MILHPNRTMQYVNTQIDNLNSILGLRHSNAEEGQQDDGLGGGETCFLPFIVLLGTYTCVMKTETS